MSNPSFERPAAPDQGRLARLAGALLGPRPARRLSAWALALAVTAGGAALASREWVRAPAHGLSAGVKTFRYGVATLPRPIDAAAWYPAARGTAERPVWYSSAAWGQAAPDAPAAPVAKRPLVILAHGWRGTRYDLGWIGESLARQGYVAASLNMPEVDAATFDDAQAPKVWYRAKLIRGLIDAIAHDKALAQQADTDHVIVMGHSAGGSAAFMLGGAELDSDRFNNLFPLSAPVVDGDWQDSRLMGIVAISPGTGPAFAPGGLRTVHVPSLILSGTQDADAPEDSNAAYYARYVPNVTWLSFANVNHYTLINECSLWGRLRGFGTCREAKSSVRRAQVHAQALGAITSFLERLQGNRRGR